MLWFFTWNICDESMSTFGETGGGKRGEGNKIFISRGKPTGNMKEFLKISVFVSLSFLDINQIYFSNLSISIFSHNNCLIVTFKISFEDLWNSWMIWNTSLKFIFKSLGNENPFFPQLWFIFNVTVCHFRQAAELFSTLNCSVLLLYVREISIRISRYSLPLLEVHPLLLLRYLVCIWVITGFMQDVLMNTFLWFLWWNQVQYIGSFQNINRFEHCLVFWFLWKWFHLFFQVLMGKRFLP